MIRAIKWRSDYLEIIDQTCLPLKVEYCKLYSIEDVFNAISTLKVRGAPLIGITAAYGLYLGSKKAKLENRKEFFANLDENIDYLSGARPTAVNLIWALREIRSQLENESSQDGLQLREKLLARAQELHEDDERRCELIGRHGQELVPNNARILTHCNTGALATGGIGTALGVIITAAQSGKKVQIYADETRPVLQGARLTMWELKAAGLPATLICDSAASWLMAQGEIDLVIVGADRIAANGATANKIGTYNLAISARHHQVPFYVAAPLSTFDLNIKNGGEIPVEIRNADEIRSIFGKQYITLPDADCWNPAFDVTPPELVTAFVTEGGIIQPPFPQRIEELFLKLNHTLN